MDTGQRVDEIIKLCRKNDLSRQTLGAAAALFREAAALAENEKERRTLFETFVSEVISQEEKTESLFHNISLTSDVVRSYRDCMRITVDALEAAAELGKTLPGTSCLDIQKREISCMIRLCAVYRYEVDMGKTILKQTDNASGDVRRAYNEKYDILVAKIREQEPDYMPEEIQRTHVYPESPVRKPDHDQTPESDSPISEKSFMEKIRELFRWGDKK